MSSEKINEGVEANVVHTVEENGITCTYFESEETVKELEAVDEANDLEGKEKFEDAELDHDERPKTHQRLEKASAEAMKSASEKAFMEAN